MTEDEIKALCKIRDKYCQWGEIAVMDKAIRLIQDQQNEIRLQKEIYDKFKKDRMEKVKQFIKSESCPTHPKHGDYCYWNGNFFVFAYGEWHIIW